MIIEYLPDIEFLRCIGKIYMRSLSYIIKSRFIGIVLPIISWNIIGYLIVYLPQNIEQIECAYDLIVSFARYLQLWFLISLCLNVLITSAIYYFLTAIKQHKPSCTSMMFVGGSVIGCMMLVPIGGVYVFMFPYFLLGVCAAEKNMITLLKPTMPKKYYLAILLIFSICIAFYSNEVYVYTTGTYILNDLSQIIINIYRWIVGGIGSLLLFMILNYLYSRFQTVLSVFLTLIEKIGKRTLEIYALQSIFFLEILKMVYSITNIKFDGELVVDLYASSIAVALVIVMYCVSCLLTKNRILAYLFCGNRNS